MTRKRRRQAKTTIARMKTFPRTSYPQRTSYGQAIDEQRFSSVPSIPTASYQTTKGDSVMVDIEEDPEPSPSEHRANETQTDESVFKDMIATNCDKDGNNMLHLAGEFSQLNIVVGAALHMQHELLWFEKIKKIVPLTFLKAKNSEGKTPKDLFTQTHQRLHKDGEKWMRDTANHCMVVATLIATVVFAEAFTIPGGNNQGN
ncbi:uncharacterized protein LOC132172931 [Corylus avellana]|uniref:uncharacterized protein LOC132172931 n=1 Tax=Corylus avellana TaxID=13451 RepID=UPI00286BB363|nr:uncharacterized protein LOC132172931 [Corylus avellana]